MPHDTSLDPSAILKTLDVHTIHSITPVTGGADTSIWRVEHDGVTSALRVFRATQARNYMRELWALELASSHEIPVPQVRAHSYWQDRPALLLSWCPGLPLAARLQQKPWHALKLGHAFGRMQALIHRIQVEASESELTGDWMTWYHMSDAKLDQKLRACAASAKSLLHLDYHPLNVMTSRTQVSGVLDWANVHLGDPRADVARTYTILVVEPHRAESETLLYRIARNLLARIWLNGYQAIAGELRDMPTFFAWAGMVMQADLAPRVTDPASWWQLQHLRRIESWTQQWLAHM